MPRRGLPRRMRIHFQERGIRRDGDPSVTVKVYIPYELIKELGWPNGQELEPIVDLEQQTITLKKAQQ